MTAEKQAFKAIVSLRCLKSRPQKAIVFLAYLHALKRDLLHMNSCNAGL
jgi:hypothetical protein